MLYTLFDFLRLVASYDRLAWNLRPVLLVHEVLVRCGREGAAEICARCRGANRLHGRRASAAFRAAVQKIRHATAQRGRTSGPTLRHALGDRPALRPVASGRRGDPREAALAALRRLEEQIDRFTAAPPGSGYGLPEWLQALNHELEQVRWRLDGEEDENFDLYIQLPQLQLSPSERSGGRLDNCNRASLSVAKSARSPGRRPTPSAR